MGTSEAVLQAFSGAVPHLFCRDVHFGKLDSAFHSKLRVKCVNRRATRYLRFKCSSVLQRGISTSLFQESAGGFSRNVKRERVRFMKCNCQAENVGRISAEDGKESLLVDSEEKLHINGVADSSSSLHYDEIHQLQSEKEGLSSNGAAEIAREHFDKVAVDPLEDEAWNLLRESVVYYCGSPVGTIAANDPTCSNVSNYDQVFIRDFIPSGIAFLLKGEYEIVRNFILHTLQLQVPLLSVWSIYAYYFVSLHTNSCFCLIWLNLPHNLNSMIKLLRIRSG